MERSSEVFVTGSTGLLGMAVVRRLLQEGYRIKALARSADKAKQVLPDSDRIQVVVGDIARIDDWSDQLAGCSALMHGAAYFRESFGYGRHAGPLQELNVEAPLKLIRVCEELGVGKALIVSSSLVISGTGGKAGAEEDAPADCATRLSPYGMSKAAMERAIRGMNPAPKIPIILVRPGWMFGPDDTAPTSAGQMVRDLAAGKSVNFPAGKELAIADVRDVAFGIVRALERASESRTYNLGGVMMKPQDALAKIAAASGKGKLSLVPVPMALGLASVLEPLFGIFGKDSPIPKSGVATLAAGLPISSRRAEEELGVTWRPFEETARDAVDYALKAGSPHPRG